MGGQGDELSEALPHKVPAEVIHLVCAIVDVSYHNSVLARVDKIPQMVGRSEQGFLFGTVNCNYIEVPELYLHHLEVGLSQLADTSDFQLPLDEHCQPFSSPHTHKVPPKPFHLVALIYLFSILQPGLLEAQDVTLQQDGVASDVFHVLAERYRVQGAHFQAKCCWVHPRAGVVVHRHLVHPCHLYFHLLINSDLVGVKFIQNVELLQAADSREHHIDQPRLVSTGHADNEGVGLGNRLPLKIYDFTS